MLFEYPAAPHVYRHGPAGYANYQDYKPWLRDEFTFRCVYCLTRERWGRGGHRAFSVEHVVPRSYDPSLALVYENLIYACNDRNAKRQDRPVLDPRAAAFRDHLHVHEDGRVEGLTAQGVAHIEVSGWMNPP